MSVSTEEWLKFCRENNRHIYTGEPLPKLAADNPRQAPKLERHPGNGSLETGQAKEAGSGRVHIRFVSVRKRLLDPDNLCEKYLLDCLRYCGAIRGDEPDKLTLETTQRRAAKSEEEHTEIVITYP